MIAPIISAVISIFSGIYLTSVQAVGPNSIMQMIANGMGWYCIAHGIYMISAARKAKAILTSLESISTSVTQTQKTVANLDEEIQSLKKAD